jgi:site-specific recombinase XerD
MVTNANKLFDVKLNLEGDYNRLYITHPSFKGRIRKRLGNKASNDMESIAYNIKFEIAKHFKTGDFDKKDVEGYIDRYIAMNIKNSASIFDYSAEFLEVKKETTNRNTHKKLSKSTLSGYRTALKYFEEYLCKHGIQPHPSQITETVLDNFYYYITGVNNYKVKLHTKLKGFLIFLDEIKHLPIDPCYKQSVFTEDYDNQSPDVDDIALSEEDVRKLIDLRGKLMRGEVELERYAKSDKIPDEVQQLQFKMKMDNLKKCLDCFLFMISTGMYYADILQSKLSFKTHGKIMHMRYRRAKTGSLCKAIPIRNDDIFIAEEILAQYNIKDGSNFPLTLSLTHFGKHLDRISALAGLDFKLNNKMARKTFASVIYFKRNLPIHYLQFLLGHKDIQDTQHYLRIEDGDIVDEIMKWMTNGSKS